MAKAHSIAYLIRARIMQQITEKHYEKGCKKTSLWVVWIRHIFPKVGVDYETYLKGLPVDVSELEDRIRKRQLSEWDKHQSKLNETRLSRAQQQKSKNENNVELEKEEKHV